MGTSKAMPRPRKMKAAEQITMRLDASVISDAEALIPFITDRSGLPATRADVVRAAIVRGLRELRKDQAREDAAS